MQTVELQRLPIEISSKLTKTQIPFAQYYAMGKSQAWTAQELNCSEKNVESHWKNIRRALNVRTSIEFNNLIHSCIQDEINTDKEEKDLSLIEESALDIRRSADNILSIARSRKHLLKRRAVVVGFPLLLGIGYTITFTPIQPKVSEKRFYSSDLSSHNNELFIVMNNKVINIPHKEIIVCGAIKDEYTALIGDKKSQIWIVDLKIQRIDRQIFSHRGELSEMTLSKDGTKLLTCGKDGICYWDLTTFSLLLSRNWGSTKIAFSKDGKKAILDSNVKWSLN